MKVLIMLAAAFLSACAGGGGGSASGGAGAIPWNAFSVTDASSLPTCAGDNIGRLYYLETEDEFKVCKTTGWTTINVRGADGSSGLMVSSVLRIPSSNEDFCTQYTGEACYFNGGQVVKYSDGSFTLSYEWMYRLSISGDQDFQTVSLSTYYPSTYTGTVVLLHGLVARGAGYKGAYLTYVKSSNTTAVWLDANTSFAYDAGDELLFTPTLAPF